jgi:hypothetical protein
MPGDRDPGITEFYSLGGLLARGGLLIGMLKVLRDDLPCDPGGPRDGIGYTVLAWTHDGENWIRDQTPLLDRDHTPGSWDHAHAWIDCQLPVGDEVYLYYGGYARGHKVNRFEERQVGLVKMKRDRYVARAAGDQAGRLVTPPVVLQGKRLSINADARGGEISVQLLDLGGTPIPGFSAAEAGAFSGDAIAAPIRWRRPLTDLAGRPVKVAFSLKHARLFAFYLESL